jgi:hypothetical protein
LAVLAQTIKSRESHPVASQTSSDNRSRRINASPTDVLSMNDISQALAKDRQRFVDYLAHMLQAIERIICRFIGGQPACQPPPRAL